MQSKQRLTNIALFSILLLCGIALLINAMTQAPKQAQIAFHSDRDGNYEIYIMNADGQNQRNLTRNPAVDYGRPDWFDPAFSYAVSPADKFRATWGWIKQSSE